MGETTAPATEYQARAQRFRDAATRLDGRMDAIANARLTLFALALLIGFGGWQGWASYYWLAPVALAFLGLVVAHEYIARGLKRARDGAALYERGLARLEGRWAGGEYAGWDWCPEGHLYARDIDVFGTGSLFDLVCQARTGIGAATLAEWLLRPADPEEVRARQEAARELAPKLNLREDLALLAGAVRSGVRPDDLRHWAAEASTFARPGVQSATFVLAGVGAASMLLALLLQNPAPVMLVMTVNTAWLAHTRASCKGLHAGLSPIVRELRVLAALLERFEREPFAAPRLTALRGRLASGGVSAGEAIKRLRRWAEWTDLQNNQLFLPFTLLLVWPALMAALVERWRASHGVAMRTHWLDALGDGEALVSLAGLAYERPHYAWPAIAEGAPRYEAVALAHPLLPETQCVRNDVRLDAACPVLIVSGSNMSGKSTLLRAIGLSAALTQAGGPVAAECLTLSPVSLGAVIRVEDSVRKGASMFYAEIERFRALLDLADGGRPLLFLSDEILHGTNTHDRVEGAKALLRALLERKALGLATTHDLALTEFVRELDGKARNVHFQDELHDGKLVFDYTLREGVVKKSNALQLMRSIGLPI